MRAIAPTCLSFLCSCALTGCGLAPSPSIRAVASYKLGFSGATVSIRENSRESEWPVASRTFILVGVDGRVLTLQLQKGGGLAENSDINLFSADLGNYLIVSERDCVEFDPVKLTARYCVNRPSCKSGKVQGLNYVGRFGWMNGYDPPRGTFQLGFRFLTVEDAVESGACPR